MQVVAVLHGPAADDVCCGLEQVVAVLQICCGLGMLAAVLHYPAADDVDQRAVIGVCTPYGVLVPLAALYRPLEAGVGSLGLSGRPSLADRLQEAAVCYPGRQ